MARYPSAVVDDPSRAPAYRAGEYELLRKIATGGMGEVFLARHVLRAGERVERRLAIKLLLPHLDGDPQFVQRFLDEARLTARMAHPNIVPVHDVGLADGRYFLAMAWVDGVGLHRLISDARLRQQPLRVEMVRHLGFSLCDALDYAHRLTDDTGAPLNVVHRDVTPSNVLVSRDGAVLLTDFGIAHASSNQHQTDEGTLRGKAPYLAPEQLQARPLDARADVYALAITLYEALTLRSPFLRGTAIETIDAVRHGGLPDPRTIRPDVPAGLAEALLAAAHPDPDQRLQSARAFRARLADGPSCAPHELGACVDALMGPAEPLAVAPAVAMPTRSLVSAPAMETERHDMPVPARRWWPLGATAAGVMAATVGWWNQHHEPVEAVVTPVVEQAPVAVAVEDAGTPPVEVPVSAPAVEMEPERTPPKVATRPQRALGVLTADATPWAYVELDGKRLGETPLSRFPLTAGTYTLRFVHPGRQTVTRVVRISAGKESMVRVELP